MQQIVDELGQRFSSTGKRRAKGSNENGGWADEALQSADRA